MVFNSCPESKWEPIAHSTHMFFLWASACHDPGQEEPYQRPQGASSPPQVCPGWLWASDHHSEECSLYVAHLKELLKVDNQTQIGFTFFFFFMKLQWLLNIVTKHPPLLNAAWLSVGASEHKEARGVSEPCCGACSRLHSLLLSSRLHSLLLSSCNVLNCVHSLGEILKMAKDDSTVRCFQGLLIFGNVIIGVSNEYFPGSSALSVIMILDPTKVRL